MNVSVSDNDQQAHAQVEAFLRILITRYGVSEDDLALYLNDLRELRESRERYRKYGEYVAQAFIVGAVTAFLSGFAWAVVHILRDFMGYRT